MARTAVLAVGWLGRGDKRWWLRPRDDRKSNRDRVRQPGSLIARVRERCYAQRFYERPAATIDQNSGLHHGKTESRRFSGTVSSSMQANATPRQAWASTKATLCMTRYNQRLHINSERCIVLIACCGLMPTPSMCCRVHICTGGSEASAMPFRQLLTVFGTPAPRSERAPPHSVIIWMQGSRAS